MNHKGLFITVEGIEGAGKSTAIEAVMRILAENGTNPVLTREPGGTPLAEDIRQLLLANRTEKVSEKSELLLMYASRAQLIQEVILPTLNSGLHVVSDRFNDATFAYQGGGRKISLDAIRDIDHFVMQGLKPDLTLLLDLPVEIGLQRAGARGDKDRIEQEKMQFFEDVRSMYLKRASQEPDRFVTIDATQPKNQVKLAVLEAIENLLNGNID